MKNGHRFKSIFAFVTACLLAAVAFQLLYHFDNKYTARTPIMQDGTAQFDRNRLAEHSLTYLADGWELFPGQLLTPSALSTTSIQPVKTFLGQYPNFSRFNADGSPYGKATYRLRIRNTAPDSPQQLVLLFQEIFSVCEIYVNGVSVGSAGSFSPYSPHVMDLLVPVTVLGDTEIVVLTENQTHYYSGITYPPILGTTHAIHRMDFIRAGFYGFLCFSSLTLALFSAAVWIGIRKSDNGLFLWFGLLSLSFSARVCYPFIRAVGVPVIRPLYAMEDIAFLLGVWCALKIALTLCGQEKSKPGILISRIALHILLAGGLFPTFVLPVLPTFVPIYGQIIFWYKLLTGVLLMGISLYGALRSRMSLGWLSAGVGVYGMSLFAHAATLNRFEPAYTGWQDEYGTLGLVLCFAVVMALRSLQLVRENNRLNEHLLEEVDKKTKRLNDLLEERRQFLAGAAHDLKAPMTSLQLFAQAVEESGEGLAEDTLGGIRIIRRKSAELQDRLLQIQSFAVEDAQPQKIEALDLRKLLIDFHEANLPDIEVSGVRFTLAVPAMPCMIMGDPARMHRVIQNIVYNALSFTPMDGVISLSLEREDDYAVVQIADTGCGISAENLPHIFARSFSRRVDGNGTGLGLYLAKSFVTECGGDISVQSEVGKGSVFTIRLPVLEQ